MSGGLCFCLFLTVSDALNQGKTCFSQKKEAAAMREQPRCKILICDLPFEKHGGPSFAGIFHRYSVTIECGLIYDIQVYMKIKVFI